MARVLEGKDRVQTIKFEVIMEDSRRVYGIKKRGDAAAQNIRYKNNFSQGSIWESSKLRVNKPNTHVSSRSTLGEDWQLSFPSSWSS